MHSNERLLDVELDLGFLLYVKLKRPRWWRMGLEIIGVFLLLLKLHQIFLFLLFDEFLCEISSEIFH
jgi:hypothetical protein